MREIFRNPQEEAHWEFRELRKDGSQIWVNEMAKVLERSGSSPVVLMVCQDISVRKEAERALHERVGLEALDARISKIVMQRESLCEMLQGCTESLVIELDAAVAAIWIFNETDQKLALQTCSGMDLPRKWNQDSMCMGSHPIGSIAEQQRPYLTNMVIGDKRLPEQKWVMKKELVAFAGYPLIWNNVLLGVMALFSRHTWTEATMHAFEMVASHITLGIEKNLSEQGRTL